MKRSARPFTPSFFPVAVLFVLSSLLFSCSGRKEPAPEPVEMRWWTINIDRPSYEAFSAIARDFEAETPHAKVKVVMLENMEYRSKLELELAAGDPPDVFHSWGGGGLADQVRAGYLRDITDYVHSDAWQSKINEAALALYSHEGRIYGFPHDLGAVGFWYNSELLASAGYLSFPEDWDGFLALCEALAAKGITPVALGIADRWPVMYWWVYLALRISGPGLFDDILASRRSFSDPALIEAAYLLQDFYRRGFLPETALGDDFPAQSRLMGDGLCAMQLMGQWALAVQAQSAEKKDALDPLMRFAPFPRLPGGKGSTGDVIGGGNGFVVGKNAPDEAIALLEFFTRPKQLQRSFDAFPAVPTVAGVHIPNVGLTMVKEYLAGMDSFSLYPDQMFDPQSNALINEVAARILLADLTPEEGCALIDRSIRGGE